MSRLHEILTRMDRGRFRLLPAGGINLPGAEEPRRPRRIVGPVLVLGLVAALALLAMAWLPGFALKATSPPHPVPLPPAGGEAFGRGEEPFRALMREGIEAARGGAFEEAKRFFRRALELNAADPEGWNNLGVVLIRQGDFAGGIEAFRRALHLKPTHAEAHRNLAVALERQGKSNEAVWHYQAFLSLSREDHPDRAEVLRRLAQTGFPSE